MNINWRPGPANGGEIDLTQETPLFLAESCEPEKGDLSPYRYMVGWYRPERTKVLYYCGYGDDSMYASDVAWWVPLAEIQPPPVTPAAGSASPSPPPGA